MVPGTPTLTFLSYINKQCIAHRMYHSAIIYGLGYSFSFIYTNYIILSVHHYNVWLKWIRECKYYVPHHQIFWNKVLIYSITRALSCKNKLRFKHYQLLSCWEQLQTLFNRHDNIRLYLHEKQLLHPLACHDFQNDTVCGLAKKQNIT